jgi:hypothetical protein
MVSKYDKYITTNKIHPPPTEERKKMSEKLPPRDPGRGKLISWVDNDVIPGAFYYESFMALKATPEGLFNDPPHVHYEWDEILGFFGTNAKDPTNLGGEVVLYIDGEPHTFTEATSVFIPRGTWHAPLIFKKVTTPIYSVTTGNSPYYSSKLHPEWEKMVGKK